MFQKQIKKAQKNIVLIALMHFIGGFGLALLLQYYISGNSFLPPLVGWLCIVFALTAHVYEWFN